MAIYYPGNIISATERSTTSSSASGMWSLPAHIQKQKSGTWPVTTAAIQQDTYFNLTTLLLHGDGTNGANNTVVVDSSVNALTVTNTGKPYQGTFSPFSQTGWSNYFNGSSDFLSIADNAAFDLAASDFTIEAWIQPLALPTSGNISVFFAQYDAGQATTNRAYLFSLYNNSGTMQLLMQPVSGSTETGITGNFGFLVGSWYHVAAVRSSNNIYLFVNGTQVGSTTAYSSTINNSTTTPSIGARLNGGAWQLGFSGYISNLRLVKGTALYTSNFTPSTTPLTAVSGTSLLTCQDNRFKDNSTNAFTVTPSGTPSVQPFSPLAPTAAYSTSTIGGSINLTGSSNYVTVPNATVVNSIGSGPFTIEGWFYPLSLPGTTNFWGINNGSGSTAKVVNYFTSGTLYFDVGNMGASQFPLNVSASLIANSAWNHIAYVRSGTGTNQSYVFVNGVLANTGTISSAVNFTNVTQPFNIGYVGENYGTTFNGYVSNFRISNTALYTSTFTLPTAPPSITSNTILQINGTNAGIIDHTAKNNITTYGTAAISSTQSKFGGTSMYFNGTTDFASIRSSNLLDFGSGDFTIEMWVRFPSNTGDIRTFLTKGWGSGAFAPYVFLQTATGVTFYSSSSGSSWDIASGVTVIGTTSLNTWYHIAVTRNGSNFRIFVDGTQVGSTFTSSATLLSNSSDVTIGSGISGSSTFVNCYIDDLRITKGYARYTSNFTPTTTAFANQ